MEKDRNIQSSSDKKVSNILKIFLKLGQEYTNEKESFQAIESLYRNLDEYQKERFFKNIIERIEISIEDLQPLLNELSACSKDDSKLLVVLSELRNHIVSPRLNIFRKIAHLPGGFKFLLDFRGDILSIQRFSKNNLTPLESDLTLLFEV
ncbi:MAG: malonyl-CoA decarboxylase N-terminal domain-containing protein [Candidatus Hodarchaeota archaeon]